jgi:hypothetical protein
MGYIKRLGIPRSLRRSQNHPYIMLTINLLTALLAPGVLSAALHPRQETDLSGFVETVSALALKSILNNIGADGSAVSGASAGIVVASPSKSDPDCELSLLQMGMTETNMC